MNRTRTRLRLLWNTHSIVPALLLCSVYLNSPALAQTQGTFTAAGTMSTARYGHTATLLADGRVLICGGNSAALRLNSAELYDPATMVFTPTGEMTTERSRHTATLLGDGTVLLVGGIGPQPAEPSGNCAPFCAPVLASAELYDPSTGRFTATGTMSTARYGQSATLLVDGRVLIAGGQQGAAGVVGAELYDPVTGTFTSAGTYTGGTTYPGAGEIILPTATLLPDGRVFLAGNNPAQIYDPHAGAFLLTGAMTTAAYKYGITSHTATLLANGKVLVAGGEAGDYDEYEMFNGTQLFDPASGTFAASAVMSDRRTGHTATLLSDGAVLIAGGETWIVESIPGGGVSARVGGSMDRAELYDPGSRTFSATGPMSVGRTAHTATLLKSGSVLITGGLAFAPFQLGVMSAAPGFLATAELYVPRKQ